MNYSTQFPTPYSTPPSNKKCCCGNNFCLRDY